MTAKKRVIKDYDTLPEEIKTRIKMAYPRGFAQNLVYYTDRNGKRVSALPFDTEEVYYLVRMTVSEAVQIIEEDEDYDSEGVLRDDFGADANEDEEIFDSVKEDEEDNNYKEVKEVFHSEIDNENYGNEEDDDDDDDEEEEEEENYDDDDVEDDDF